MGEQLKRDEEPTHGENLSPDEKMNILNTGGRVIETKKDGKWVVEKKDDGILFKKEPLKSKARFSVDKDGKTEDLEK